MGENYKLPTRREEPKRGGEQTPNSEHKGLRRATRHEERQNTRRGIPTHLFGDAQKMARGKPITTTNRRKGNTIRAFGRKEREEERRRIKQIFRGETQATKKSGKNPAGKII